MVMKLVTNRVNNVAVKFQLSKKKVVVYIWGFTPLQNRKMLGIY